MPGRGTEWGLVRLAVWVWNWDPLLFVIILSLNPVFCPGRGWNGIETPRESEGIFRHELSPVSGSSCPVLFPAGKAAVSTSHQEAGMKVKISRTNDRQN